MKRWVNGDVGVGSMKTKLKEGRDSMCTSRSVVEQGGGLPMCRDKEDLRLKRSILNCSAKIQAPEGLMYAREYCPRILVNEVNRAVCQVYEKTFGTVVRGGDWVRSGDSPCSRIVLSRLC